VTALHLGRESSTPSQPSEFRISRNPGEPGGVGKAVEKEEKLRKLATSLVTVAIVLTIGATAYAGDMAITSFDSLPATLESGKTYTLTYSVLQHGVTPVDGDSSLIFTRVDDGERLVFEAEPTGEPGRYQVEVTIPVEGEWEWQVTQGPFAPQHMEPITVQPGAATVPAPGSVLPTALTVAFVLVAVLAVVMFLTRRPAGSRRYAGQPTTQPD
jgi:hypothetical protein